MPRANRGVQIDYYPYGKNRVPQWVVFWYEQGKRRERGTGILDRGAVAAAEEVRRKFADLTAEKPSGPMAPDRLLVGKALTTYFDEHGKSTVDAARIAYAIKALRPFWNEQPVSAITG